MIIFSHKWSLWCLWQISSLGWPRVPSVPLCHQNSNDAQIEQLNTKLLLDSNICYSIITFDPQFWHIMVIDHCIYDFITICFSSILTFAPQFWHYTPTWNKRGNLKKLEGAKPPKSGPNLFAPSWYISEIHLTKRPFQPSAVVRTIYRGLYGVATTLWSSQKSKYQ